MSFRYMNPGYGELLTVSGTTITDKTYNPYSGVALRQAESCRGVVLPYMPTEIYMKATFYMAKNSSRQLSFTAGNGNGFSYEGGYYPSYCVSVNNSGKVQGKIVDAAYLKENALNEILMYFKAGTADSGHAYVNINGTVVLDAAFAVEFKDASNHYVANPDEVEIYTGSSEKDFVSNIILSDLPIDIREHVIELPVKSVESDMTKNEDGSYTSTATGQVLWQQIDWDALVKKYGGDSKLTGLMLETNPAYRTGEVLKSLVAVQQDGQGNVKEIGTPTELSLAADGKALLQGNVQQKFSELVSCRYGLKAGGEDGTAS